MNDVDNGGTNVDGNRAKSEHTHAPLLEYVSMIICHFFFDTIQYAPYWIEIQYKHFHAAFRHGLRFGETLDMDEPPNSATKKRKLSTRGEIETTVEARGRSHDAAPTASTRPPAFPSEFSPGYPAGQSMGTNEMPSGWSFLTNSDIAMATPRALEPNRSSLYTDAAPHGLPVCSRNAPGEALSLLAQSAILPAAQLATASGDTLDVTSRTSGTKEVAPASARTSIETPRQFDVLCGRGKKYRYHPGNRRMKELVSLYREAYVTGNRSTKSNISSDIVQIIKSGSRAGSFLRQEDETGGWIEVSDEEARKKIGHAIRDSRCRSADDVDAETRAEVQSFQSLKPKASLQLPPQKQQDSASPDDDDNDDGESGKGLSSEEFKELESDAKFLMEVYGSTSSSSQGEPSSSSQEEQSSLKAA